MRLTRTLAVLLALAGSALAGTEPDRFGDGGVPAFYRWTGPVPEPGTLLRSETLPADLVLSNASRGERILYASTDGLDGQSRIAVSGALFWPKGDPPPGGWPIVAWAHGRITRRGAALLAAGGFALAPLLVLRFVYPVSMVGFLPLRCSPLW